MTPAVAVAVIISANAEWREVRRYHSSAQVLTSPYGEYFVKDRDVLFFHGGWGKIAAAASAQYVIDRWHPRAVVNLGTCGGIAGRVNRHDVLLVERTVVYDVIEQMGDAQEALDHYSTAIDLIWLKGDPPSPVRRALLVSADRDLVPSEIAGLEKRFHAVAADWESGAIAWVAARNKTRVLILRGVSDLVSAAGGEAYGNPGAFTQGTAVVMKNLLDQLPAWLAVVRQEIVRRGRK